MPLVGRHPEPDPRTEAGRRVLDEVERGTEDWDDDLGEDGTRLDVNLRASERWTNPT
jgi:hypothetical protein